MTVAQMRKAFWIGLLSTLVLCMIFVGIQKVDSKKENKGNLKQVTMKVSKKGIESISNVNK